jgi:hypothetical protein
MVCSAAFPENAAEQLDVPYLPGAAMWRLRQMYV